jgi:four helix bundle protein
MAYVKSFRDLEVYKLTREVIWEIYNLSKEFPIEDRYSLTDQIRRSSRSIGSQVAESWGKRRYELHFISKLTNADSEQLETQHWVEISSECNYIDKDTYAKLIKKCESIGKMLHTMIEKSGSFCKSIL